MGEAHRGYEGKRRTMAGGLAVTAVSVAAASLLAGCQGSGSAAASQAPGHAAPSGTATASAARAAAAASGGAAATAGTVAFVPVTEPFDPGHPARATTAPADCASQDSTLAIEQCFEGKTETADAAIDTLRKSAFDRASAADRTVINADDRGWLATRGPVCARAYQSGGTIDGISIAGCLLDESTARLASLRGPAAPEAVLKSTDSTSPGSLSWYTTPVGSRIAMSDTQGDASGGVIVSWVIIAGADGFVINPAQFSYRDGTFADQGTAQGTSPSGHRVAPGTEYQFSVDYSQLAAAPAASKNGGWVYAPGAAVAAVWR
jgi:uncharacterized protein YecT (DUF1311 family)